MTHSGNPNLNNLSKSQVGWVLRKIPTVIRFPQALVPSTCLIWWRILQKVKRLYSIWFCNILVGVMISYIAVAQEFFFPCSKKGFCFIYVYDLFYSGSTGIGCVLSVGRWLWLAVQTLIWFNIWGRMVTTRPSIFMVTFWSFWYWHWYWYIYLIYFTYRSTSNSA